MKRNKKIAWALNIIGFFLIICIIVTSSILAYDSIRIKSGGDTKAISIALVFLVIFISVVGTLIQVFYQKVAIDNDVKEIRDASERIAHGDFNIYLTPSKKGTDFDDIKEDINTMARELKKNAMAGNNFISNVSHEIKTPLAVIRNSVDLLDKGNLSKEEYQEYFLMLKGATERLSNLVTDILSLNKMENNKLKPNSESVNLEEILTDILLNYENVLDKKGLELICDFEVTKVNSSSLHLKMIFSNLISNAIKFTDKGSITIKTKKKDRNVLVVVTDTGCGISKDTGSHIFEKFYQGDTSHKTEGNGLGMPMVKSAVAALKGDIRIESEVGKGTEISVEIPDMEHE